MADTKLSALVELAATPADTDEVYIRDVSEAAADESKRITVANLIAGAGGTKEFFVPVGCGTDETTFSVEGDFQIVVSYAYHSFKMPHDFTSIVAVEAICSNGATESLDVRGRSDYGAVGETTNTHSEEDAALSTNFIEDKLTAIDISGILSALVADDIVGIDMSESGVRWMGIRFRYS